MAINRLAESKKTKPIKANYTLPNRPKEWEKGLGTNKSDSG
jgi:hypothetical protein